MNLYKVTFKWPDGSIGQKYVACDSINDIESCLLDNRTHYETITGTELITDDLIVKGHNDD